MELSHSYDVQPLYLCEADIEDKQVAKLIEKLMESYKREHKLLMDKVKGIVLFCGKVEKRIH